MFVMLSRDMVYNSSDIQEFHVTDLQEKFK
jgi:hypothetical protein